jgi:hypothetical protein
MAAIDPLDLAQRGFAGVLLVLNQNVRPSRAAAEPALAYSRA